MKIHIDAVIKRDSEFWYCQGVQIDYVSQGNSKRQAKERFKRGLLLTVESNIKKFGSIKNLLKWSPMNTWGDETYTVII